ATRRAHAAALDCAALTATHSRGDAHELDVGVGEQAFESALLPAAAVLDSPEGRLGLRDAEMVDPHHAGLQLAAEAVSNAQVARECVGRQPVAQRIGTGDSLLQRVVGIEQCDRAEGLLALYPRRRPRALY